MNRYILMLTAFILSASVNVYAEEESKTAAPEVPAVKFSQINGAVEIFAEYELLVTGERSRFIAHFTNLLNYKPISNATAVLYYNNKEVDRATEVLRDGIFILNFTPVKTAKGHLRAVLHYNNNQYEFKFKESQIFGSVDAAIKNAPAELEPDVVFLKEQAWIGEFGVAQAKLKLFEDVIHTSGQIIPANDNRISIISQANGVVNLKNQSIVGRKISKGQLIAGISGKNLENSRELAYQTALAEFKDLKSRYSIAAKLVKNQSISQKEFSELKASYESAKVKMLTYGTFNGKNEFVPEKGKAGYFAIESPRNGYISSIKVRNGDYVNSGDVIAEITVGESFLLQADFPKHEMSKLNKVVDAYFVPEYAEGQAPLSVSQLGGVPMYSSKLAAGKSPYIPYYFNIPGDAKLIPNSFATIAITTRVDSDQPSIVIPSNSLLENENNYWVYVELEGENYTRRDVVIGANNGREVVIKEGLKKGEVVVTIGAYRVKQAASSGEIPEHAH